MTIIHSALASVATLARAQADEGLSFDDLVAAIPTDPASLFTLLLLVVSIALVVWFGRPKRKKEDKHA